MFVLNNGFDNPNPNLRLRCLTPVHIKWLIQEKERKVHLETYFPSKTLILLVVVCDVLWKSGIMLDDWQVHQIVTSSKVKIEIQVSNPHGLCLYLGRWIYNF